MKKAIEIILSPVWVPSMMLGGGIGAIAVCIYAGGYIGWKMCGLLLEFDILFGEKK